MDLPLFLILYSPLSFLGQEADFSSRRAHSSYLHFPGRIPAAERAAVDDLQGLNTQGPRLIFESDQLTSDGNEQRAGRVHRICNLDHRPLPDVRVLSDDVPFPLRLLLLGPLADY